MKVTDDKHGCKDVSCADREHLKPDATCEKCADYKKVSDDKKLCETVNCEKR